MNEPPGSGTRAEASRLLAATRAVAIAGATAVGKSAVALCVAEALDAEILSVDSMQVYRGLDLGTAKPTPAEQARVPHHLLDVADLREPFDAARWRELALAVLRDLAERGRRAVLCGGTGLYFRVLEAGLGLTPPTNPTLRAELENTPLPDLLAELAARDPATFARVDQRNPRRVFRAVEILRLTGRPASEQRPDWSDADGGAAAFPLFALVRETADLHARIATRVDAMFAGGLVDETRRALALGLGENRIALQAIGYRQVAEHLAGERDLAATVALVKTRTRQFARRQMTWFRHQARARWLPIEAQEPPALTAARIMAALDHEKSADARKGQGNPVAC